MPQKCSICKHPKRQYINRMLMNPRHTLRRISVKYAVSQTALARHRDEHISKAIQLARENGEIKQGKSSYEQFEDMLTEAENKYRNADVSMQVQWFREWRAMLELAFKLGLEAERRREHNTFSDVSPAIQEMIDRDFPHTEGAFINACALCGHPLEEEHSL